MLKDLVLETPTGIAESAAPITHWTMKSLSTGTYQPTDDTGFRLSRRYTAHTSFEVKFQHFTNLGSFASSMSTMDFVTVNDIQWRLTDATRASLGTKSRKDAIKNAVAKARDYADALGKSHVIATEVEDGYASSSYGASGGVRLMSAAQQRGSVGEELSFEPEDVTLNCQVTVKFTAEDAEVNGRVPVGDLNRRDSTASETTLSDSRHLGASSGGLF